MDARRGRAAVGAGSAVVLVGSLAWALAATAMSAVQAAEARALGPGHTADMPGEDELALVAHDSRLAAMVAVACGLALVVAALPRGTAGAVWLGGAAALVVANATLGRAVDGGHVLVAAAGLLLALVAGCAAGAAGARRRGERGDEAGAETGAGAGAGEGARRERVLVPAGLLAAGTLAVLPLQGLWSERYAAWVPADVASADLVTASALTGAVVAASLLAARGPVAAALAVALPVAALLALVRPSGGSLELRDDLRAVVAVLALAAAPLALAGTGTGTGQDPGSRRRRVAAAAALVAAAALSSVVPHLLVVLVIFGGMLGMVLTVPAGAYINYDGFPVVGGGALLAASLLALRLAVRTLPPVDRWPSGASTTGTDRAQDAVTRGDAATQAGGS